MGCDGPYNTSDEALVVAMRSLIARARAPEAQKDMAINGPDEDFATYQFINELAGTARRFTTPRFNDVTISCGK